MSLKGEASEACLQMRSVSEEVSLSN